MSVPEMLEALDKKGQFHVYLMSNMESMSTRYLIKLINPALLVQQGQLQYRLQLCGLQKVRNV